METRALPEPTPEGVAAVQLARRALTELLARPRVGDLGAWSHGLELPATFEERRGVFVTLLRFPSEELRGCIGYPMPTYPLREAIPRAAYAAARDDPRFPPVRPDDLERLLVEVSVLTLPARLEVEPRDRLPALIRVGTDGLIVRSRYGDGLLLPQVAPEQGWDAREFLGGTCEKAGLPADAWRSEDTQLFRFTAEVHRERVPGGSVLRRSH